MSMDRKRSTLIRVAVLDDHSATRAGLEALLTAEPDIVSVGSAGDEFAFWPLIDLTAPTVVVLDSAHRGGSGSGFVLALQLKRLSPTPRVILYSGMPRDRVSIPAALAGVDAVVSKYDPPRVLMETIRAVTSGDQGRPSSPLRLRGRAAAALDATDMAIVAMRLDGTSVLDIATALGVDHQTVMRHLTAVVGRLGAAPRVSAPRADDPRARSRGRRDSRLQTPLSAARRS